MASRGRRRPRVEDSDGEDVLVLNELNNSARSQSQHILLSDDEDDSFTAPNSHPPQQMPSAWLPVVEVLHGRGVKPRTEWLLSCLNKLAASYSDFAQMPAFRKAELCFEQFLMADMNMAGAAVLPASMHSLHATELPGPFVLQVDEITDISNSARDRYQEKAAGPGRTLKLSMTDGVQRVYGMEYRPIKALQVFSPAGLKVSLRNVCVRRGLLLLVPEILEIMGGVVERLETARLRAVETINKPPRGRRVPRGTREPSLAESATRAAWPDETGEDSRVPPAGTRSSTVIPTPGTTHSARDVQRREQHRFNSQDQDACLRAPSAQVTPVPQFIRPEAERSTTQSEAGQLHQRAQPSREAFNESVMNQTPKVDVVQHVHQHQHDVQQDQSLGLSRQSGRASCTPRLTKFEVVQEEQHQRCQQEHGAETSRQEGSTAVSQQALRVGTVHQGGQTQEHSRHEAESSRQASKFRDTKQCVQSATLQQGEQGQVSHNRPAAEPTKLSVPYAAEGPTQSPGVPLLSPSLGKLSLRSRRSTQSTVSLQSNLQSSQPSQSSLGEELERNEEITEPEDKGCGLAAEETTHMLEIDNIPFTYLSTLDDTRQSNRGQDVEARGRVKELVIFSTRAVRSSSYSYILRTAHLLRSVLLRIRSFKVLLATLHLK
ncbi:RecQ-mediated genome instability protein 1 [Marchantia polymorpha subsp. ruderalis]|uniref:RecQ-mediated genome instability protein 1 n=2 Tax=Marchantia polymorpha TaxID=3197 RepID=A0AAF6BE28_MARPO|nr:hypothetical protein MARPO_0147s0014 [Marchantia polymorpha]BBN10262.1 hypothetical protein Mp_5g02210 [Marchantia polymorpha subsp. ruderalis]|eukprot:PTQ29122.1 hypothetical protein MARPO_0147s0014 [Marchantia polymorpha]